MLRSAITSNIYLRVAQRPQTHFLRVHSLAIPSGIRKHVTSTTDRVLSSTATSKEKGDALEKQVVEILRMDGAKSIQRNVVLRDPFGNRSEIDVIYTPRWPPFFAQPRYVECKNYAFPVPFEMVTKFKSVLELNNIPLHRGLFITTSTFTPRATTLGIKTMDRVKLNAWKRAVTAGYKRRKRLLFLSKFVLGLLITSGILSYITIHSNSLSPHFPSTMATSPSTANEPKPTVKTDKQSSTPAITSSSATALPFYEKLSQFTRSGAQDNGAFPFSRDKRKAEIPPMFVPLSKRDGWAEPPLAERFPEVLKERLPESVLHWIYLQHAEIVGSYEWGRQNVLRDRVKVMERRLVKLRERMDPYYTKGHIEQTSSQWRRKLRRETSRGLLPRGKKPSTMIGLVLAGSGGSIQAFQDLRMIIRDLFFP